MLSEQFLPPLLGLIGLIGLQSNQLSLVGSVLYPNHLLIIPIGLLCIIFIRRM